ncbi:MAG: hypothetical protein DLM71_00955 [Chloroflexi bacterium]|nr:MAG: hypothetical protein DLM71_00955 [Chloroflexota bacterium]
MGGVRAGHDDLDGKVMGAAGRSRASTVGPIESSVDAPAALVYEMLSSMGQPRRPNGEQSTILAREGNRLVCEFWTLVPMPIGGGRIVRTREEVRLLPPDRVQYRHLDGPLRDLREEIVVEPLAPRRTRLRYCATYRPKTLLHRLGFAILRPLVERTMVAHFTDLRGRAEARARRSRVYPAS